MFAVVGTVPDPAFPLLSGKMASYDGHLSLQGRRISVQRGTPALLAAAIKTTETLAKEAPVGYLVGDIGSGEGSQKLYQYLVKELQQAPIHTLVFHYLQPHIGWHCRILSVLRKMVSKPVIIADAGFMYVAKMNGQASVYDLFTPDLGELAFLADELAPHPFYTRGFLLHEENRVPDLIARAYRHGNAARYLLVKGKKDYIANKDRIQGVIENPTVEAMEAIGGTGDTLTGITGALIASGIELSQAAIMAARTNRLAGYYAHPSPGTQVNGIIPYLPKALEEILKSPGENYKKECVKGRHL